MSLSIATVSRSDFDTIYDHVITHRAPRYSNMHARQHCYRKKRRVLKYLHGVYASVVNGTRVIEGAISGPCTAATPLYWHYKLMPTRTQTQLVVIAEVAPAAERARMGRVFVRELLRRVRDEQSFVAGPWSPTRLPGQWYLRRELGGMSANHPYARQAVSAGDLDARFVARLASWDLRLIRP